MDNRPAGFDKRATARTKTGKSGANPADGQTETSPVDDERPPAPGTPTDGASADGAALAPFPPPEVYDQDPPPPTAIGEDRDEPSSTPAETEDHGPPEGGDHDPDEILVLGQQQPRIPDRVYQVRYSAHEFRRPKGRPKLAIEFTIVAGEYRGTTLTAWRNISAVGERTSLAANQNSKITIELRRIAEERGIKMRPSKLTMGVLRDVDLLVQTKTTGQERPYSVISDIVRLYLTARTPTQSPHCGAVSENAGRGDSDGDANSDSRGGSQHQRTTANKQRTTDNAPTDNGRGTTEEGGSSDERSARDEWIADYDDGCMKHDPHFGSGGA